MRPEDPTQAKYLIYHFMASSWLDIGPVANDVSILSFSKEFSISLVGYLFRKTRLDNKIEIYKSNKYKQIKK